MSEDDEMRASRRMTAFVARRAAARHRETVARVSPTAKPCPVHSPEYALVPIMAVGLTLLALNALERRSLRRLRTGATKCPRKSADRSSRALSQSQTKPANLQPSGGERDSG
jgi:hypothetical protein